MSNLFNINNKIAIVTGASRGIGKAIATGLNDAGVRVYGLSRTKNLTDTVFHKYYECNINNNNELSKTINDIGKREKRIDILVNAAGISLQNNYEELENNNFDNTILTNLKSVFQVCNLVIPFMKINGGGSIINITSIGSNLGFPNNPGYLASKAGLSGLTRALAYDFGTYGIRVNNLVPGYFRTSMTEKSYLDKDEMSKRSLKTLLNRWGNPEELAGAVIFLSSQAGSYVTGIDLVVDGGWSIKGI